MINLDYFKEIRPKEIIWECRVLSKAGGTKGLMQWFVCPAIPGPVSWVWTFSRDREPAQTSASHEGTAQLLQHMAFLSLQFSRMWWVTWTSRGLCRCSFSGHSSWACPRTGTGPLALCYHNRLILHHCPCKPLGLFIYSGLSWCYMSSTNVFCSKRLFI